ncbi:MAG: radical SAM protein [Gudongella sp.]|jgi:histone acetyltransferase (RNA polymerase elongator complex component)|nr:radical SAM protein [Gudongella sp.]
MSNQYIIPVFVPHLGCPHDCVFCNQKKITGLSTSVTTDEVQKIIDEHLDTFKKELKVEVAFYGGSFTAIDINTQRALLSVPFEYKLNGRIDGIRLSTRPDAINHEILRMLKDYGVDTIELGVQSMDEYVLSQSERGHTQDDVIKSAKLIKDYGFSLGLQQMVGLPGDSYEKDIDSTNKIIALEPDFIRIYPTLVIKGTELERMLKNGLYRPLSVDEAVNISADILMMAVINDIDVIRIGLQPTENIREGGDVVAGPFHPSIRQLTESRMLIKLLEIWKNQGNNSVFNGNWTIYCDKSYISTVSGQKGTNKKAIKELFEINNLKIKEAPLDKYVIVFEQEDKVIEINLKEIMEISK